MLRFLQHRFNQVYIFSSIYGWHYQHYQTYKILKSEIKSETEKIRGDNYTNSLEKLINSHSHPKIFWKQIKELKSASHTPDQHLVINNTKLTTNEDKEQAFRKVWKDIFKITPEENTDYDIDTENEMRAE